MNPEFPSSATLGPDFDITEHVGGLSAPAPARFEIWANPDANIRLVDARQLDLAWAAGFLDGEGCFTLIKQSGATHPSQRSLYVGASQSTREPLEKLESLFGGTLNIRSRPTDKGTIMHVWLLGQNSKVVQKFIPQVLPYLIVKKREAEILLEFAATVRRRGRPKRGAINFTSEEEIATRMRLIDELNTIRGKSAVEVVMPG